MKLSLPEMGCSFWTYTFIHTDPRADGLRSWYVKYQQSRPNQKSMNINMCGKMVQNIGLLVSAECGNLEICIILPRVMLFFNLFGHNPPSMKAFELKSAINLSDLSPSCNLHRPTLVSSLCESNDRMLSSESSIPRMTQPTLTNTKTAHQT